jgi:hypothetical protein
MRRQTRSFAAVFALVFVCATFIMWLGCSPKTENPRVPQPGDTAAPTPVPALTPAPAPVPAKPLKEYPEVVMGKDNWLFDGTLINHLLTYGALNDTQIEGIVNESSYINNSLKQQGVDFFFILMPDKRSIYQEFMPDYYNADGIPSSYDRLSEALSKTDIDFIDCKPLLLQKKTAGYRLYYMRDTHLNQLGNFYVLQEILAHLGKKYPVPRFEFTSINTDETRVLDTDTGNNLNNMIETLSPWREKGAPEPVYNVYQEPRAPSLLWYGTSNTPPLNSMMSEGWPNLDQYMSMAGPFGWPLSLRQDISRRVGNHKIVIFEIAEHYRWDLSHILVPEPSLPNLAECKQEYNWQPSNFLQDWKPVEQCDLSVENDVVLAKVKISDFTPSFCTSHPLSLEPSRIYYLVIKIASPVVTGVQAYFSRATRDTYIETDRLGQHIFEGDNTVILEIPDQEEWGLLKNIRIHPGAEAGIYRILEIAIYSEPKGR